jgi:hypothetical protein
MARTRHNTDEQFQGVDLDHARKVNKVLQWRENSRRLHQRGSS